MGKIRRILRVLSICFIAFSATPAAFADIRPPVSFNITCAAGEYLLGTTCQTCPAGYWCPGGTYTYLNGSLDDTPEGHNACPAGTYNPDTGKSALSDCISADPGYYVPVAASTSQTKCSDTTRNGFSVPTYSDISGATACTPCPEITDPTDAAKVKNYSYWGWNIGTLHDSVGGCYVNFNDGSNVVHGSTEFYACYNDGMVTGTPTSTYGTQASCDTRGERTTCDAGYYIDHTTFKNNHDNDSKVLGYTNRQTLLNNLCIKAGDATKGSVAYYSPAGETVRYACPDKTTYRRRQSSLAGLEYSDATEFFGLWDSGSQTKSSIQQCEMGSYIKTPRGNLFERVFYDVNSGYYEGEVEIWGWYKPNAGYYLKNKQNYKNYYGVTYNEIIKCSDANLADDEYCPGMDPLNVDLGTEPNTYGIEKCPTGYHPTADRTACEKNTYTITLHKGEYGVTSSTYKMYGVYRRFANATISSTTANTSDVTLTCQYGDVVTLPTTINASNTSSTQYYIFDRWRNSAGGSNPTWDCKDNVELWPVNARRQINFYKYWGKYNYVVPAKFIVPDGCTGISDTTANTSMVSAYCHLGSTITYPTDLGLPDGITLVGWATGSSNTTAPVATFTVAGGANSALSRYMKTKQTVTLNKFLRAGDNKYKTSCDLNDVTTGAGFVSGSYSESSGNTTNSATFECYTGGAVTLPTVYSASGNTTFTLRGDSTTYNRFDGWNKTACTDASCEISRVSSFTCGDASDLYMLDRVPIGLYLNPGSGTYSDGAGIGYVGMGDTMGVSIPLYCYNGAPVTLPSVSDSVSAGNYVLDSAYRLANASNSNEKSGWRSTTEYGVSNTICYIGNYQYPVVYMDVTLKKNGGSGMLAAPTSGNADAIVANSYKQNSAGANVTFTCLADSSLFVPNNTGLTRTGYNLVYPTNSTWINARDNTVRGNSMQCVADNKTMTVEWTPKCIPVQLVPDNGDLSAVTVTNATPNTIYLKYGDGWYSDNTCTTPITQLTTLPSVSPNVYEFNGYFLSGYISYKIFGSNGYLDNDRQYGANSWGALTKFSDENATNIITAYWRGKIFTITLDDNGGTGGLGSFE